MPWPGLPAREQEGEALHVFPLCPELAAAEPRRGGDPLHLACWHFKSGLAAQLGGGVDGQHDDSCVLLSLLNGWKECVPFHPSCEKVPAMLQPVAQTSGHFVTD